MTGPTDERRIPPGVVVAGLGVAVVGVVVQLRIVQSDLAVYRRYGLATLHSHGALALPREYPALAGAVFAAVAALHVNYTVAFGGVMAVTLVALLWTGSRLFPDRRWAPRALIYLTAGTVGVVMGRFDLLAALAVAAAVGLASRRQWAAAWAAAGLGVALKLFPALLLPGFFIAEWRTTGRPPLRRAGATLVVAATYAGIQQLIAPGTLLSPITYEARRGFELSSVGASVTALFHPGGLRERFAFGAVELVGPHQSLIAAALTVVTVCAAIAVWILAWRGRMTVETVSLAVLTIAILGDRAFAPQYLIWVIPLWALRPLRVGWLLAAALTTLVFPASYLVANHLYLTVALATVRNGVLLTSSLLWLRQEAHRPSPITIDAAPTGAPQRRLSTRHIPKIAVGGQPS